MNDHESPDEIRRRACRLRECANQIEAEGQTSADEDWLILEMRRANDTPDPADHCRRLADEYEAAADALAKVVKGDLLGLCQAVIGG